MAKVKFHKVSALPGTPEADSIYMVQNGSQAEYYVTDAAGALHDVGNTAMITGIANTLINSALSAQNSVEVFADITARDAATITVNSMVVVIDASGDPTVTSGSALYIYQSGPDTFDKLSEFESLDVVLDWNSIVNGPSSSAAQIDAAVAANHTHSNKTELDRLDIDVNDCVLIDGNPVYEPWATAQW